MVHPSSAELSCYTPISGDIYKGANYALKQWDDVKRILESPEYQLDNNEIEREIRSIAIGRKNWLFAGSKRGANSAAVIFTILNTCKIHGVNPIEYLTDILPRVLDYTVNNIDDLTPLKWKIIKLPEFKLLLNLSREPDSC
jgi:transposase